MNKIILVFTLLVMLCMNASAQQDAMYSQYMFNMLSVNPAYAGSREVISLTALARRQWLNVEGAPKSASFSADLPVWQKKVGLGIQFVNDKIGVTKNNSLLTSYSYRINLGKNAILAFGLQGGFTNLRSDLASLTTTSGNDPVFMQNVNIWMPNFGTGIYYKTDKFYVGFSAPHLLDQKIIEGTQSIQQPHYFIMAGYVFELSQSVLVKPSLLLKHVKGVPVQGDININVWVHKKIGAGVSYRTGDAIVTMAEFMITRQICFGYAYDITITPLHNYTSGSHEIMLRYQIGSSGKDNVKWPYF